MKNLSTCILFSTFILASCGGGGGDEPYTSPSVPGPSASINADSTCVSADHEPEGSGGLILSCASESQLTVTKNWSQGFHDYDVTVGMPSSGSAPYPVAILLHGNGGNGAAMVADFANDLPRHILIGVQGYSNSWNIVNETSKGPDIEMLEDLVAKLQLYNNVDNDKIRIVGTSNGGALALRAAVEIGDVGVDAVVCMISQAHNQQYRNNYFHYPSNHEQIGDEYANDGYDLTKSGLTQRKIIQMNGRSDTVIPYAGGSGAIPGTVEFLSAAESAYRFGASQGFGGIQQSGNVYGADSLLVDYGGVIFLNDDIGHGISADMRRLLNKYLESNFDTTY